MFGDQARPLYGQAERLRLDVLPAAALAEFIAARFDDSGRDPGTALGPVMGVCGGHPQRSMLAAHHLWQRTPEGGTADLSDWADAEQAIIDAVRDELVAVHAGLSASQRRVLRLLSFGEPLHGSAAGRLRLTAGSATQAARSLARRSIIVEGPAGRPTVVDPLLALWVRRTQSAP